MAHMHAPGAVAPGQTSPPGTAPQHRGPPDAASDPSDTPGPGTVGEARLPHLRENGAGARASAPTTGRGGGGGRGRRSTKIPTASEADSLILLIAKQVKELPDAIGDLGRLGHKRGHWMW